MNSFLRLTYIALYILFLLMVFLLFATVSNASAGSKASLFIFITLLLGTGLFGLAMLNQKVIVTQLKKSEDEGKIAESTNLEDAVSVNVEKTQKDIDIHQLLPSDSKEIMTYTDKILQNMADDFSIVQAIFYVKGPKDDFQSTATYAYFSDTMPANFKSGETLPGQAVKNKTLVILNNIPENYTTIVSGLGKSVPKQLVFVPLKKQQDVVGLIEYATFETVTEKHQKALEEFSDIAAVAILKLLKK
jgi:hypothetical protein